MITKIVIIWSNILMQTKLVFTSKTEVSRGRLKIRYKLWSHVESISQ
jgi:hypothetical protein